jgi:hypothetical protein
VARCRSPQLLHQLQLYCAYFPNWSGCSHYNPNRSGCSHYSLCTGTASSPDNSVPRGGATTARQPKRPEFNGSAAPRAIYTPPATQGIARVTVSTPSICLVLLGLCTIAGFRRRRPCFRFVGPARDVQHRRVRIGCICGMTVGQSNVRLLQTR